MYLILTIFIFFLFTYISWQCLFECKLTYLGMTLTCKHCHKYNTSEYTVTNYDYSMDHLLNPQFLKFYLVCLNM